MTQSIDYFSLWTTTVGSIPYWELAVGVGVVAVGSLLLFFEDMAWMHRLGIFHSFERIRIKRKDLEESLSDSTYIEITIPKDSHATAFQIQQKIIKSFHSVFLDPIDGQHHFSKTFYLFQKMYRLWKVSRSKQIFFTLQVFARYPYISFRANIPSHCLDRIEKAIFNAYPNAEIAVLEKASVAADIAPFPKHYLAYGQSTVEGPFWQRIRTLKDVSSDPVDSIVSVMEGLGRGQFMAYNILFFPASHFFNQVINVLLEDLERRPLFSVQVPQNAPQQSREADPVSELMVQLKGAMVEKMKSSLFQAVISYWAVADTKQEAESKLANIQAVLTELNQKNMNTLKHRLLFTRQVEELNRTGELQNIVSMKPVLEMKRKFLPFVQYENNGQIIFDSELYSLWHLPNTTSATVSSIKMTKYRKLPATQRMRESSEDFFVKLGSSDFRAQEASPVGISTWDDMKKHIYILGGTGAGKSETLKTIISSLLHKEGEEKTACLIVDPKNDFATDLLTMIPESRRDDVVYFNPSRQKERPLSFPFFSKFSGEKEGEERIEFIISVMKRFVQIDSEYSWGPELENILRNLFATAYLLPEQSLSGLDMLLHEPTHIKNILRYLPSRLQQFWTGSILKRNDNDLARYLATTNNKLGKFLDYPEFMNIADRFDTKITFEEMIASGKIFIANFGSSSEQMKKYYSVYLTAHIASAIFASAQISSEKRKPAVFVVDEFQRVASDIFETLFSEVRAFNTALVVSNQFMGQLSERIQKSIESNIATKIFMRTQSMSDAAIAQTILGEKATAEDIINLPTGAAYLKTLVHGIPQDPMSIRIDKTEHPTEVSKESEEYFIRHTMEQYGTPLDVIRQKRETVNSAYYTSEKEQVFFEHMGKRKTFEPAQTNEMPISSSPQPVSAVVTSGLEKTLFDYSS